METIEKNVIAIHGTLNGYKTNKHGDVDALEITTADQLLKINFPPHTAKSILNAAQIGEQISLAYEEKKPEHDPKGDKKPKLKLLSLINAAGNELMVSDIKPQKKPSDSKSENLQPEHFELLKGKKGELFGIRSGKQLIHVHKEDQEFADKIKPDSKLQITAVKRTDDGFVNEQHDDVYHIQKIVIDDQEYATKK